MIALAVRLLRAAGLSAVGACLVLGADGDAVERAQLELRPKTTQKDARWYRARRERRLAAGLCTRCERNPIAPTSRSRCEVCLAKARAHEAKRRAAGASTPDDVRGAA